MPTVGEWTTLNDVDSAEDGEYYYAIFEYVLEDNQYAKRITDYDLTPEEAWPAIESHNNFYGIDAE